MVSSRDPFEHTHARWKERERKEREEAIRRPVEKQLAEATAIVAAVRAVVDRVMGDDDATNGETKVAEELDGIVPARAAEFLPQTEEAELEREARALLRRQSDGVDGLDWDRRVLAKALQIQRDEKERGEVYVPSGQTMAALGWVPEKGEPGFEERQRQTADGPGSGSGRPLNSGSPSTSESIGVRPPDPRTPRHFSWPRKRRTAAPRRVPSTLTSSACSWASPSVLPASTQSAASIPSPPRREPRA